MKVKYTLTKSEAEAELTVRFQQREDESTQVTVEVSPNPPGTDEVSVQSAATIQQALVENNLVTAIKELRACVPMSLLAAKRIVEAIRDGERARQQ